MACMQSVLEITLLQSMEQDADICRDVGSNTDRHEIPYTGLKGTFFPTFQHHSEK